MLLLTLRDDKGFISPTKVGINKTLPRPLSPLTRSKNMKQEITLDYNLTGIEGGVLRAMAKLEI